MHDTSVPWEPVFRDAHNKESIAGRCEMPVQKPNKAESVRNQWTKQRKGEAQRFHGDGSTATPNPSSASRSGGSHFAKPSASDGVSEAVPMATAGTHAKAVVSPQAHAVQAQPQVSAQPRPQGVRVKRPPAQMTPYSRYSDRYRNGSSQSASVVAEQSTHGVETVRSWLPYIIYGGVSVVASVLWCVLARTMTQGPLAPGSLAITLGLVVLCAIVGAGIALAVVIAKLTAADQGLSFVDAFAPAIGKTALMMALGVIVWIVSSAVVTL